MLKTKSIIYSTFENITSLTGRCLDYLKSFYCFLRTKNMLYITTVCGIKKKRWPKVPKFRCKNIKWDLFL